MTTSFSGTIRRNEFSIAAEIELVPGTTTALVGPNGAGKSSIVEAFAGLVRLDDGEIRIAGRTVDAPAARTFVPSGQRGVGIVFQDYALFPHLTGVENVAFGPLAGGVGRADAMEIAERLLRQLEVSDVADRRPAGMSGGQAQRVALARALAINPALLLLDEPLSALDVETRSATRRSLASQMRDFAGPRLIVTHDPIDAFLLADRIVVLEAGVVVQSGTPDQIRRHPATPYVAAFSGRNLLSASADNGHLTVDGSDVELQAADTTASGAVLVTIAPSAIALHHARPEGSPRNSWPTTIDAIEPLGDVRRVILRGPLELSADLTPGAVESMALGAGTQVWASIKATEVHVTSVD